MRCIASIGSFLLITCLSIQVVLGQKKKCFFYKKHNSVINLMFVKDKYYYIAKAGPLIKKSSGKIIGDGLRSYIDSTNLFLKIEKVGVAKGTVLDVELADFGDLSGNCGYLKIGLASGEVDTVIFMSLIGESDFDKVNDRIYRYTSDEEIQNIEGFSLLGKGHYSVKLFYPLFGTYLPMYPETYSVRFYRKKIDLIQIAGRTTRLKRCKCKKGIEEYQKSIDLIMNSEEAN